MAISFEILGSPGRDNALLVRIDSGQSIDRLLFDCGEGCLNSLSFSEIQGIDHLCFSHQHMDHIGGFDSFFRCLFDRTDRPNHIWGPPGTAAILHHRFQGFLWNLHEGMQGNWLVSDVSDSETITKRYEVSEAFAVSHDAGCEPRRPFLIETQNLTVEAHTMNHRTPTLAYVVREKYRQNIDMQKLAQLGFIPGPWLKQLKSSTDTSDALLIDGVQHSISELRKSLLVETPGESIAYLTDFILDDVAMDQLSLALQGCKTLVCECQYRHNDIELARRHYHMTSRLTAELARRSAVEELILFHLSDRYDQKTWLEMLAEAQVVFPATSFPAKWNLGT